ncbi:MAG: glutamate--cysteine ligase [Pseudomonadota bacterium]|jgi:glutamate--cysteine ligase
MSTTQQRLAALSPDQLRGMRRGLEKESLRAQPNGQLALTPHPAALGSALTHPHITTDYSESQLELITGVHSSVESCLAQLGEIHQYTVRSLRAQGDEMLWASSMPCGLPTDETIPLGRYGSSNVGRAKSVYRMGLGHRYGRRMQTISGIHYNWSLPGLNNDDYFGLIRNFRRHAFLLLTLFGASPAVCGTFVQGRPHELLPLGTTGSLHMPHGTSLRMGRLGYQSDAQATLAVSYNGLEGYAASLHDALTRPWPAYEALGIRNPGGDYNQLATTLLQIENEFYGTIRPKRVIFPGERPLHALRERGVEYIEVRLMDLNPFEVLGIGASTLRFLDVFLLHCLLAESPPDSPAEIEEMAHNQHLTAARGREPGLCLQRQGQPVPLMQWGLELLNELQAIAQRLDDSQGTDLHQAALAQARTALQNPALLPSAQVLHAVAQHHHHSFLSFARTQSQHNHSALLALPWSTEQQTRFEAMAAQSVADQRAIEAADTMPFEIYRQEYTSPHRLGRPRVVKLRS